MTATVCETLDSKVLSDATAAAPAASAAEDAPALTGLHARLFALRMKAV